MLKNVLIVVAIVLGLGFVYFGGLLQNKDKIHQAELEMQKLRYMKDSLQTEVKFRDSLQVQLKSEVNATKNEADALRDQVNMLEEKRKEEQLSVRRLRKKEDLQARLRQTFPEMAESDWGVTEVTNEEFGVALEYLTLHVGLGTFQPVRAAKVEEHRIHDEWFDLPGTVASAVAGARERGGRIVAVGTTVVRTLEWCASGDGLVS